MLIVTYRKIFFAITGVLLAASFVAMFGFGLHLSTDFTGGTLVDAHYVDMRPSAQELAVTLTEVGVPDVSVREAGGQGLAVRAGNISDEVREALPNLLSIDGQYTATIDRLSEVGPIIGVELRNKSIVAITFVLLAILLFIAFVFRKVSRPVSSWAYGLIALVTLVHNIIITIGFFALLGYLFGAQIDTLFVTAVLTVLGFSVHDTIVVFDRIRENLRMNQEYNRREDFEITIGRSLNQTFVRSLNTSLTAVFPLLMLFFLGPVSTQNFSLTLLVGIVAGTYSSLALASPLLVVLERRKSQR